MREILQVSGCKFGLDETRFILIYGQTRSIGALGTSDLRLDMTAGVGDLNPALEQVNRRHPGLGLFDEEGI